jgi:hypothetical protein
MQIEAEKDLSEVSSHVRSLSAFLQTSQPYLASWRTAVHASMSRLRDELNIALAPKTERTPANKLLEFDEVLIDGDRWLALGGVIIGQLVTKEARTLIKISGNKKVKEIELYADSDKVFDKIVG